VFSRLSVGLETPLARVGSRATEELDPGDDFVSFFWRGIYDDRGRVMVAMTPNSDIGDSWEWADEPRYDERFSALGIRIGVNYIVYAMRH
jgi:hypothetical protein